MPPHTWDSSSTPSFQSRRRATSSRISRPTGKQPSCLARIPRTSYMWPTMLSIASARNHTACAPRAHGTHTTRTTHAHRMQHRMHAHAPPKTPTHGAPQKSPTAYIFPEKEGEMGNLRAQCIEMAQLAWPAGGYTRWSLLELMFHNITFPPCAASGSRKLIPPHPIEDHFFRSLDARPLWRPL